MREQAPSLTRVRCSGLVLGHSQTMQLYAVRDEESGQSLCKALAKQAGLIYLARERRWCGR